VVRLLFSDFRSLKEMSANQNGLAILISGVKARPHIFRIGVDYRF
jgi:hypothetical protein